MKRRKFLTLSLTTATLLLAGCGSGSNNGDSMSSMMSSNSSDLSSVSVPNFNSRLVIPPLLEGVDVNGVLNFDLNIQKGITSFFEGTTTNTFGINGNFLGSTLRVKNGDNISINFTNYLDEDTTMHSHGMHLPAVMDGGVHQIIKPNNSWSSKYTVKQKACTNWYHPHLMGKTAKHVYKGLAGMIIVEDDDSISLDIPKTYGVDDIPLIFQDRFFDANYEFDYSPSMMEIMRGYNGDVFLLNGKINPYIELQAKEVRFRLLNGSNSTVYDLGFDDFRSFKQIATDNSFLEKPVDITRVKLSPGERAEIVVNFSNEQDKTLYIKDFTQDKEFLKIDIIDIKMQQTTTPDTLTSLQKFTQNDATNKREFVLSGNMNGFYINGVSMDKDVINEIIPLNQVEIWEVTNDMMLNHNFHIHATHFMILKRNSNEFDVEENEKGYKDTVLIPPNESVTLIVKMTDYKDNINPYMYHCHFLEHEDAGMMGQFIVV